MPLPFVCFESWFVTCEYHPALPSRTSCGIKSATLRVFSCQVNFMVPWNWWNSLGSKLGWTIDLMTYDLSPWLKFWISYSLLQLTWEIWEKPGLKASKCDKGVHSSWKIDRDSCIYIEFTQTYEKRSNSPASSATQLPPPCCALHALPTFQGCLWNSPVHLSEFGPRLERPCLPAVRAALTSSCAWRLSD